MSDAPWQDVCLTWHEPMTSSKAEKYFKTMGFVAVELYSQRSRELAAARRDATTQRMHAEELARLLGVAETELAAAKAHINELNVTIDETGQKLVLLNNNYIALKRQMRSADETLTAERKAREELAIKLHDNQVGSNVLGKELAAAKEHIKILTRSSQEANEAAQEWNRKFHAEHQRHFDARRIADHVRNQEYWLFQNDKWDEPQSLVCPVIMSADQFRSLIAAQAELAAAERESRLVELLLCVLAEDDKYGNLCGTLRSDIEKELKP